MLLSCDSGSLPFLGDYEKFLEGGKRFRFNQIDEFSKYFEKKIVDSFLDKIRVNINVPNYPQFRDMNEMIFSMIDGLEKTNSGYLETNILSLKKENSHILEVFVIEQNSQVIHEKTREPFLVRVCAAGPYTLSSFFPYKDEGIFRRLGNVISQMFEHSLFSNKHGKVSLVSVDEPLFGLLDDPLIDFGTKGRENLLTAWQAIFHKIKSKNAQTMLHLHSTANPLFWDISSLDIIDSHVDDPIYQMKKTKELLESKDKFLKASITINDFDKLIKKRILGNSPEKELSESIVNQKIADVWTDIKLGKVNPNIFLESVETIKKRLVKVVELFGSNRVLYAGPECGLKGYPNYNNALKCLERVSSTVKNFDK